MCGIGRGRNGVEQTRGMRVTITALRRCRYNVKPTLRRQKSPVICQDRKFEAKKV